VTTNELPGFWLFQILFFFACFAILAVKKIFTAKVAMIAKEIQNMHYDRISNPRFQVQSFFVLFVPWW